METNIPKFKIDDIVKFDGQLRPNCPHENEEYGRVMHQPNFAQPYYLIEVLGYDGIPLKQVIYYKEHPVTVLLAVENLTLV